MSHFETLAVLGNRVLIRREEARRQTDGGIFLPDAAQVSMNQGEVIKLGTSVEEGSIAVGKTAVYPPFSATPINIGDEELLVVPTEDILVTY